MFATGIAPGFASDILAVHAASMSALPTKVSVQERIPCGAYRVPGFPISFFYYKQIAADNAARATAAFLQS